MTTWLRARPTRRVERTIAERPLLHACCGEDPFGDVRLDKAITQAVTVCGDVRQLPFRRNTFAAAFCDFPWEAPFKGSIAMAMRELLRIAPVVYVLSPWVWGSRFARLDRIDVCWQPGVTQALLFTRYVRR